MRSGLQIEDQAGDALQLGQTLVEVCGFIVDLGELGAHAARFSNKAGVVSENEANRVQGVPGGRVELGVFDQIFGDFEGRSHNADYA